MVQEVFLKLKELQEVLSSKHEIEFDLKEIPRSLSTRIELLNRMKRAYVERNTQVEDMKKRVVSLRQNLIDADLERETLEGRMATIKTQREYEALDKEINDATEKENRLRKDLEFESVELKEQMGAFEREEAMIKSLEEELKKEEEKIESESQKKRLHLQELQAREDSIVPGLDEEILFKFERIIRNKSGVGIVPINDTVCSGCHMVLPAQFRNDVREGASIHFCPYCSRILYYEEGRIEEPGTMVFSNDDFGHFADS